MMRAGQVRALHAAGMDVGAHTLTHPILANQPIDVARREIVESGERLSEILRAPVRLFAYPNGKPGRDYGPEHVRIVRQAGYVAAVSTAWGVAGASADRFQLPRFTPWDRTPGRFALRLIRNAMLRTPETVPAG
jgi:peptidoglycan/xylan/chitin deacetylase (PgdA/CDA1 family)